MKNILYQKMIFIIVLIIYLIFFVLTIPTYVSLKVMSFSDEPFYNLCSYIFSAINKSEIIYNFFWHWVIKISEWTLVTSFVVNIANMVFGFINFKKKWWYYVILLISILLSVILIDCWWMLYTAE